MNTHGILLAGGTGSRLYPITSSVNKQLLPIYNKPMIFYSLSLIMLAGIREVTIVCNPKDIELYQQLLGRGESLGMNISYTKQLVPNGIPSALALTTDSVQHKDILLVLGDNILVGNNLSTLLKAPKPSHAKIFPYMVKNANQFGVITFDDEGNPLKIEEKPYNIHRGYAIPGVYFLPNSALKISKTLTSSDRGETEVSDLLNYYLAQKTLTTEVLGRGIAWMDTGTPDGLSAASQMVQTLESRQNYQIGNIHEIAYKNQWITRITLVKFAEQYSKSDYGKYLLEVTNDG
jgi:glucose-1-phosphate thymidylyltransferase